MRYSIGHFAIPFVLIAVPSATAAQTFADFCPTADSETESAIVGWVTDPDADTVVPGATVAATWVQDGARRRVEAQANLEGLYALCGLPPHTEVSLRAALANRRGEAVTFTTAETLAQQDLAMSLTAEAPTLSSETGSMSGGRASVLNSMVIRDDDLVGFPEMSVYDLLRQHQRLRFDRFTGQGEVILLDSVVSTSLNNGRFTSVQVRINERREVDPIPVLRQIWVEEIRRIEILSAGDASARYGGDGWVGAISITTRDR